MSPASLLSHPCPALYTTAGKILYPTTCLTLKCSLLYQAQGRLRASRSPDIQWKLCECHSFNFACIFLTGILLTSKSVFSLVPILLRPKYFLLPLGSPTLDTQDKHLFSAFHCMFMCLWSREGSCNYPRVIVEVTVVQSLNDQFVITSLGFRTVAKIQILWCFFCIPTNLLHLISRRTESRWRLGPGFSCRFCYSLDDLGTLLTQW